MRACTNAQEVMAILSEEGYELNDEQLEAVTGGSAATWSIDDLIHSFGDLLADLLPDGYDPMTVWGNLPTGSPH